MKKESRIVQTLRQINDDAWCQRTYHKAVRKLLSIKDVLDSDEVDTLKILLVENCDPNNPDFVNSYHDKAYVSEYIKSLIIKYSEVK